MRVCEAWVVRGVGAALCVALAVPAGATPTANRKIPVNDLGCALCHADPAAAWSSFDVTVGDPAALTEFGDQWLSLGGSETQRAWSEMSGMNADNDGCSNWFELGDREGTYQPRATDDVTRADSQQVSDPTVEDCTLPLDEQSWGTLKQLFGSD